ncbi:MAG: hypothetical protein HPY45_12220 [Anaerolineae bacterium]|nr:hypothetical protein [Anaerolineae bacterium]
MRDQKSLSLPSPVNAVTPEAPLLLLTAACFPVITSFFQMAAQPKTDHIDRRALKEQLKTLFSSIGEALGYLETVSSSLLSSTIIQNTVHPIGQNPVSMVNAQRLAYQHMVQDITNCLMRVDETAIGLSTFSYPFNTPTSWWDNLQKIQLVMTDIVRATEFNNWIIKLHEALTICKNMTGDLSKIFNSPLRHSSPTPLEIEKHAILMHLYKKQPTASAHTQVWAVSPLLFYQLMTTNLCNIAAMTHQLINAPPKTTSDPKRGLSCLQRMSLALIEVSGLQKAYHQLLGPGGTMEDHILPAGISPMWLNEEQLTTYRHIRQQTVDNLLLISQICLEAPRLDINIRNQELLAQQLKHLQVVIFALYRCSTYGDMNTFVSEGLSRAENIVNTLLS